MSVTCNCTEKDSAGNIVHRWRSGGPCDPQRVAAPPAPPPVCTGSGYPPILPFGGIVVFRADCGICGQTVQLDGEMRCVTHPYLPTTIGRVAP